MNEGTFAVEIMPQVFSLSSKGDSEVVAAARSSARRRIKGAICFLAMYEFAIYYLRA